MQYIFKLYDYTPPVILLKMYNILNNQHFVLKVDLKMGVSKKSTANVNDGQLDSITGSASED